MRIFINFISSLFSKREYPKLAYRKLPHDEWMEKKSDKMKRLWANRQKRQDLSRQYTDIFNNDAMSFKEKKVAMQAIRDKIEVLTIEMREILNEQPE